MIANFAHVDRPISRPQMPEQQCRLIIPKAEHICWQPLFVRSLVEDAKLAQPPIYSLRMPPIAIAGYDQLMPLPASSMTIDGGTESASRGVVHQRAIRF